MSGDLSLILSVISSGPLSLDEGLSVLGESELGESDVAWVDGDHYGGAWVSE